MFIRSIIFCILLVALAVGILLALLLPSWLLAIVLAGLVIIYGIIVIFKC